MPRLEPAPPPQSQKATAPLKAVPGAGAEGQSYIGETACVDCHDEQMGVRHSPHHRSTDPRTPAAKQSCETCHGPGGKHLDDPVLNPMRDFKKIKPAEVTPSAPPATTAASTRSGTAASTKRAGCRARRATACTRPSPNRASSRQKTQLEVCATCHRDKVSKLDRSGHMPVREGKMQCSTCHNTHGTTNVKLLRKGDSIAELCTSCHAEKRGPYLWEHAPGRDGCVTCHDPHGSPNERMLVAKPPILCQRCHVGTRHPSTIYDAALIGSSPSASIRVYARSCVTCHAAIHGSNHPSGQRFIR